MAGFAADKDPPHRYGIAVRRLGAQSSNWPAARRQDRAHGPSRCARTSCPYRAAPPAPPAIGHRARELRDPHCPAFHRRAAAHEIALHVDDEECGSWSIRVQIGFWFRRHLPKVALEFVMTYAPERENLLKPRPSKGVPLCTIPFGVSKNGISVIFQLVGLDGTAWLFSVASL